ncbi:MAG: RNA polymerase sigma factor [Anaerolineales bacterium]
MITRDNAAWVSDLRVPGDLRESALADLRTLLARSLPRGLSRWLSPGNPEFSDLIEDTIQDTLMRVIDQLDKFEGKGQFTNWAYKIAVRIALNELRRRKWRDVSLDYLQEETEDQGAAFQFPSEDPLPDVSLGQKEVMVQIEAIINEALTAKQRRVMTAVIIQGVPMEEVARRMGSNRNAIYKLLHDARQKIKSSLEKDGLRPEELLAMFAE